MVAPELRLILLALLLGVLAWVLGCFKPRRDPCRRCPFAGDRHGPLVDCRVYCDTYQRYQTSRQVRGGPDGGPPYSPRPADFGDRS